MKVSTAGKVVLLVVLECLVGALARSRNRHRTNVVVSPATVNGSNMTAIFSWNGTKPPDEFEVTLIGSGGKVHNEPLGYLAMGLSKDNQMGDDLVVACIPKDIEDHRLLKFYYTERNDRDAGVSKLDITKGKPTEIENKLIDGRIECTFRLPAVIESDKVSFNLNTARAGKNFWILFAEGPLNKSHGIADKTNTHILKHDNRSSRGLIILPTASGNKIIFESTCLALFFIFGYFYNGFGTQ